MFETAEEMEKFDEDTVKVPFGSKHVDAAVCVPGAPEGKRGVRTAVVLTHGAGGDMNAPHLVSLAHALASSGFLCLRFTCKGPNLAHRAKAYRAVWDYMKSLERFHIEHIFIGGQTHAHRQRSEVLRALPEHVPVLFVSGTEDNMCDRVLFDRMLTELKAPTEVFWLQGGSHGLKRSMAGGPWNRVNVARPGAVSSVRIRFSSATDRNVAALLVKNNNVLKLIRSEILQTEVRLLYELQYVLNNSFRGNKTLKGLERVEQCINRLKAMKLDEALEELTDLCPNRIQRGVSIRTGECDVPSQPTLEWLCLKVLGAAQLMSCTLSRCSRAFTLSKQQMKWDEFIILNMVITSMLSRLWVIFRGVLVSLSALYQQLLEFLGEVAQGHPMPFLTDFSLPADMAQLLGPSHAALLSKQAKYGSHAKDHKGKQQQQQQQKSSGVGVTKSGQTRRVKEDLGVAVERAIVHDTDMKPFLKAFRNLTEGTHKADEKQTFKKQAREATSFTDMAAHLEEMIVWCKSQRMEKEKRLLTFLRLKCHRMACLEAAGYNVRRKLQSFRRELLWAASPQGSAPKTCRSSAALRRNARPRRLFQSLRSRFRFSTAKTGLQKKRLKTQRRWMSELSEDGQSTQTIHEATPQTIDFDDHDDIDDIFASVGV
ncbi:nucleolus and neural progenitor protein isoform X3 [Scophthalmus maximus]|uniref:nucleolus and neural progenitor protein isoform X3 n=1 Tax=Scophthalmus maximus TaxID=52904 RepID=UPI001FA8D0E1|nr:nucleolus and neural progenitor protein isoform X3 [Scophthalmus maximus]